MSDPRPNELSGQVQPNTLSTEAGRRSAMPPVGGAPGWAPRSRASAPSVPPAPAPSLAPAGRRQAVRRPFGVWALIVAVVIGLNLVRAFGSAGGGGTDATTEPTAAVPAPSLANGGETIAAVDVAAGTVVFGTSMNDACDVTGAATRFPPGVPVWWYAHLNAVQAGDATVVTILKLDGVQLDRGKGPDSTSGAWDGLCAGSAFRYDGSGTYRFEVWDAPEATLLASGEYEIGGES